MSSTIEMTNSNNATVETDRVNGTEENHTEILENANHCEHEEDENEAHEDEDQQTQGQGTFNNLHHAKTKAQISCAVTAQLISAFVFATCIVQFLFYLYSKFQASSLLLWLHRPVCVGSGWNPTRGRKCLL